MKLWSTLGWSEEKVNLNLNYFPRPNYSWTNGIFLWIFTCKNYFFAWQSFLKFRKKTLEMYLPFTPNVRSVWCPVQMWSQMNHRWWNTMYRIKPVDVLIICTREIRLYKPTLEFSQSTKECLWYLQISNRAHGQNPFPVFPSAHNMRGFSKLLKLALFHFGIA